MQYEAIDNGFSLTFKEGSDEKTLKFFRRSQMTTWQLGKVTGIIGSIFKDCSAGAQSIFSLIATVLRMEKPTNDSDGKVRAAQIQRKLEEMILGGTLDNLAKGGGELLSYIAGKNLIAQLIAALYLKEGEGRVEEEEFKKRIDYFDNVPPTVLMEGLGGFFTNGTGSSKSIGSPSMTSEPTKSELVTPTLTEATA